MNRKKRAKRIIIFLIVGAVAALMVFGVLQIRNARMELKRIAANQTISSAAVTQRNIRTKVIGNGTLTEGNVEELKMPKGLKIKEVLVETGDMVTEGQVLAKVDHSSVRDAIADVQSQINNIDTELLKIEDQKRDEDVKAPVGGDVETIYAENGSNVSAVMESNGALLVLTSDDDQRDVRITALSGEVKNVSVHVGDHVKQGDKLFTLHAVQDEVMRGKLLTQRQDLNDIMNELYDLAKTDEITSDRTGIVREIFVKEGETLTDSVALSANEKPAEVDTATLYSALLGGNTVMSTKRAKLSLVPMFLFAAPGLKEAQGFDTEYDSGQEIASFNKEEFSAIQENFIENTEDASFAQDYEMVITEDASAQGYEIEITEDTSAQGYEINNTEDASSAQGYEIENEVGDGNDGEDFEVSEGETDVISTGENNTEAGSDTVEIGIEVDPQDGLSDVPDQNNSDLNPVQNAFLSGPFFLPIRMPSVGTAPMQLQEAASYLNDAIYSITSLEWNIAPDQLFEPGGNYSVSVTLRTNTDNHIYLQPDSPQMGVIATGSSSSSYSVLDTDGDNLYEELHADVVYPELISIGTADPTGSSDQQVSADPSGSNEQQVSANPNLNLPNGTNLSDLIGNNGSGLDPNTLLTLLNAQLKGQDLSTILGQTLNGQDLSSLLNQSLNGLNLSSLLNQNLNSQALAALLGSSGLNGLSGLNDLNSLNLSSLNSEALSGNLSGMQTAAGLTTYADAAAFSIAGAKTMDVTIAINELDILSVAKGQSAEVTMDAIEGETFSGTVKEISKSGTNSGGVTKYQVTVEIDRDERMRPDMSSTVSILVGEAKDVYVVPSAAVFTEQGKNYVYTIKEDDGTLSGKAEIETGIADGEYVEILSGLAEGQMIYYRNKAVNYFEKMMGSQND